MAFCFYHRCKHRIFCPDYFFRSVRQSNEWLYHGYLTNISASFFTAGELQSIKYKVEDSIILYIALRATSCTSPSGDGSCRGLKPRFHSYGTKKPQKTFTSIPQRFPKTLIFVPVLGKSCLQKVHKSVSVSIPSHSLPTTSSTGQWTRQIELD